MQIGQSDVTRLTRDPAPDWNPRWSPDSSRIACYSYRTGNRDIWVMPAAGGRAIRLTASEALDATPDWSPNGSELAFRSERTGSSDIWIVPADGGQARQVTREPAGDYSPGYSPDGNWLAFWSNRGGQDRLWRVGAEGGEPVALTEGPTGSLRWSRDGQEIYAVGLGDRAGTYWAYSVLDRQERLIVNLAGRRGELVNQAPATDGTHLYFSWREDLGDIWVMDISP